MARFIAFVAGMYAGAVSLLLLAGRLLPEAGGTTAWQFFLAAVIVFWPAQAVWLVGAKASRGEVGGALRGLWGGFFAMGLAGVLSWLVKAAMDAGNSAIASQAWSVATMLVAGLIVLALPGVVFVRIFPEAEAND